MGGIISGKIVGAAQITGRVCASSISAGDYTITIDPIESGYRLRVERGGEVQTMELLDGKAGADGQASYVHIKYSSVSNPASSDEMSDAPQDYIGIYADNVPEDSGDPADYTWARIKGEPGLKGDPGEPGLDAPQESVLYTPQTLTTDQQAQARENVGAASAELVEAVEAALPGKLTEPAEGLAVGKYFRVAALDENGHAVLEAVDAPKEGLAITPTEWPAWTSDEQAAAIRRIGIGGSWGLDLPLIKTITLEEGVSEVDILSREEGITLQEFSVFMFATAAGDDGVDYSDFICLRSNDGAQYWGYSGGYVRKTTNAYIIWHTKIYDNKFALTDNVRGFSNSSHDVAYQSYQGLYDATHQQYTAVTSILSGTIINNLNLILRGASTSGAVIPRGSMIFLFGR